MLFSLYWYTVMHGQQNIKFVGTVTKPDSLMLGATTTDVTCVTWNKETVNTAIDFTVAGVSALCSYNKQPYRPTKEDKYRLIHRGNWKLQLPFYTSKPFLVSWVSNVETLDWERVVKFKKLLDFVIIAQSVLHGKPKNTVHMRNWSVKFNLLQPSGFSTYHQV
jgi:hypothetical protein